MKKNIQLMILFSSLLFTACNTATPNDYFGQAVLNTNTITYFAGEDELPEFHYGTATMGKNGETVPMKRKEILDDKIKFIEEALGKIKGLKETDDTKEMLHHSIELYEYVLPV